MKLSDFDINFEKFKNESDVFHFDLDHTFFALKENSLYNEGVFKVDVHCTRNENNVTLKYQISGHLCTVCDRCLKSIQIPVETLWNENLKFTSNEQLLEEEAYLSAQRPVYSVYDSIYETICLSLPSKLLCKFSSTNKTCKIKHYSSQESTDDVDHRWEALKKLKL